MTTRRKLAIAAGVILATLALDHATKWIAIHTIKESGAVYSWLWDMFRIQYAENTGAFLSLGSTLPDFWRFWVMTGLNSLILIAVAVFLGVARFDSVLPPLAFSLILAGGVGNLIDRVFRDGRVVDFLNVGVSFGSFNLRSGIFNIADLAIVGGLALILAHEFLRPGVAKRDRQDSSGD